MSAEEIGVADWADYEPKTAEEVVALALLATGIWKEPKDETGEYAVQLDLTTAGEIVNALRQHEYTARTYYERGRFDAARSDAGPRDEDGLREALDAASTFVLAYPWPAGTGAEKHRQEVIAALDRAFRHEPVSGPFYGQPSQAELDAHNAYLDSPEALR